jgi:hypothetical protein
MARGNVTIGSAITVCVVAIGSGFNVTELLCMVL